MKTYYHRAMVGTFPPGHDLWHFEGLPGDLQDYSLEVRGLGVIPGPGDAGIPDERVPSEGCSLRCRSDGYLTGAPGTSF